MKSLCILLSLLIGLSFANAQNLLDTSFGESGIFIQQGIDFGGAWLIADLGNDRIVCTSYTSDQNTGAPIGTIFSIDLAGNLDQNFADAGVFRDDGDSVIVNQQNDLLVHEGEIYSANSIVMWDSERSDMAITKLTSQGVLDSNFGKGGYATLPLLEGSDFTEGSALAIDQAGSILVAGEQRPAGADVQQMIVAKFLADGTVDTIFAENGVYEHPLDVDKYHAIFDITVNDDNEIYVFTNEFDLNMGTGNILIAKLTPSGELDTSFGNNGVYSTTENAYIFASRVTVVEDGSFLISGAWSDINFATSTGFSTKVSANGELDADYGIDGFGEAFVGGSDIIVFYAEAIETDEDYVFLGDVFDFTIGDGVRRIICTKLNKDGTFVDSYGSGGTMLFDSPIDDYIDLRGNSAITINNDFYIASESSKANFDTHPTVVRLTDEISSAVDIAPLFQEVSISPNPVNSSSTIHFQSLVREEAVIKVTNPLGQVISSQDVIIEAGSNCILLQRNSEHLPDGVYYASIVMKNQESTTLKFMKVSK